MSDHFDGQRFFDPDNQRKRDFWAFLKWQFTGEQGPWPEPSELPAPTFSVPPARVAGEALRVTYVGHATVLLQTQGLNILTDPIWSERASPFSWLGPKRRQPPGVPFASLPKIDVVFVSHNHYDHLDLATLRMLHDRDRPLVVTPLGNDAIIRAAIPDLRAQALDWGGSHAVSPEVRLHLVPVQHWSARGVFDTNRALWGGLVIEAPGGNVYAALDTGYGGGRPFMKARDAFGAFRFVLLPIGAFAPRWFMEYAHMTPEEALEAAAILGAERGLAIHYDVFPLADDGFGVARQQLVEARQASGVPAERLQDLEVGAAWEVPSLPVHATPTRAAAPAGVRRP